MLLLKIVAGEDVGVSLFYLKIAWGIHIFCLLIGRADVVLESLINEESAGRVYFNHPLTRQTCRTFTRSRANLNGPIRNALIIFFLKPIREILFQGSR